jgi:hypothetical protein
MIVRPTDQDWARGYAKQALSDLRAREALVRAGTDKCHRLHFLQMAAEKACKAYLATENGHANVRKSHAYVKRHLPTMARHFYKAISNNKISQWEISEIRRLAKEIELLAPACDDGDVRRDNAEYPWEDSKGRIQIPCEYEFPGIDDGDRRLVRLVKLIYAASEAYSQ